MERLKELLSQISKIVLKEKTQQEEKRKRGENFNIFKVLGLSTSEVRLHSAFLAELLNPNGDHGLGDCFLKSFINNVICKKRKFEFECCSAKVDVEYHIGTVSSDYKEGGRIDLLIRDKNRQTIIIENKIYADDQPWQMYRYNMYAQKTERLSSEQYVLLYLTLNESEPSEESTGKEDFEYLCISYKKDILPWLDYCIGMAALYPKIRETLSQYELTLKNVLEIMSETTENSMIELLTSDNNIEATLGILSVTDKIKISIRRKFIDRLINELQPIINANDMVIDLSDKEKDSFANLSKRSKILIKMKSKPFKGNFCIEVDNKQPVTYGLWIDEIKYNSTNKKISSNPLWKGMAYPAWPLGWDCFYGNLCNWNGEEALLDMVKGYKIIDIVKNELQYTINQNGFEELEKLLG